MRVIKIVAEGIPVAVVIHGPDEYYTALETVEELEKEGYKVIRLNTGYEPDAEFAEKLEDVVDALLRAATLGAWTG